MFGDLDGNEVEHRIVPIAKLIDLGEANERPVGESRFPPDRIGIARYDDELRLELRYVCPVLRCRIRYSPAVLDAQKAVVVPKAQIRTSSTLVF